MECPETTTTVLRPAAAAAAANDDDNNGRVFGALVGMIAGWRAEEGDVDVKREKRQTQR